MKKQKQFPRLQTVLRMLLYALWPRLLVLPLVCYCLVVSVGLSDGDKEEMMGNQRWEGVEEGRGA